MMNYGDPEHLRVLVANERRDRLTLVALVGLVGLVGLGESSQQHSS